MKRVATRLSWTVLDVYAADSLSARHLAMSWKKTVGRYFSRRMVSG